MLNILPNQIPFKTTSKISVVIFRNNCPMVMATVDRETDDHVRNV